jgi:hypothetical protein
VIPEPRRQNAFSGHRRAFWTLVAAGCLLLMTDWVGEICAVVIARREANRALLPSSYGDTAHRNVTYRLHRAADVTSR